MGRSVGGIARSPGATAAWVKRTGVTLVGLAILAVVGFAIWLAAGGIGGGSGSPLLEFPSFNHSQLQSSTQSTAGNLRIDDQTYLEPEPIDQIVPYYETALNTPPWTVTARDDASQTWTIQRTDNAGGSGMVHFSASGRDTLVHVRYSY